MQVESRRAPAALSLWALAAFATVVSLRPHQGCNSPTGLPGAPGDVSRSDVPLVLDKELYLQTHIPGSEWGRVSEDLPLGAPTTCALRRCKFLVLSVPFPRESAIMCIRAF